MSDEKVDMINHPPHYTQGGIECIDALEAASTQEEFRGFLRLNAMKYLWRARHKGGIEDYKKGIWYLNKLTQFEEKINSKESIKPVTTKEIADNVLEAKNSRGEVIDKICNFCSKRIPEDRNICECQDPKEYE